MYDFEDVNRILSEMGDEGMVEPIDDSNPEDYNPPETMVDENGIPWYVY